MDVHPGIFLVPAVEADCPHTFRPGYDREEEENLLHEHVGEVVWPNFVSDGIAVDGGHTVANLTVRALLEFISDNFLPDADTVVLLIAVAGLDELLAVLRLATADAQARSCGNSWTVHRFLSRCDALLLVGCAAAVAYLESALELALRTVIQSILTLLNLDHSLKILVLSNDAVFVAASVRIPHRRTDALRLDLIFQVLGGVHLSSFLCV